MSNARCCVPGCPSSKTEAMGTLHKFPNPSTNKELFNTWVYSIGGDILHLKNDHIFKYRRVCHIHFEEKYCCRNNRLSNIALPTKHMPGISLSKFRSEERVLRPIQIPSTSSGNENSKESDQNRGDVKRDCPDSSQKLDCEDNRTTEVNLSQSQQGLQLFDGDAVEDVHDAGDIHSDVDDKETKGNQFSWQKSTPICIDDDDDIGEVPHVPALDVKVKQAEEKPKDTISEDHKEYFCDSCTNSIVGPRYRCVECDNYDLCSRCEARHARHYMLRIPRPRPFKEIQSIIDAIREKIKEFSKELTDNSLELDEIKLEPDFIDPAALDPLSTPRVHTPLPAPDPPPSVPTPLPPTLLPHSTTEITHKKTYKPLYVVRGDTHKPKVIQLKNIQKPQNPAVMDLLKKLNLIKGNEKTHKDGNTSKRKLTTFVAESSVRDKTFKDTEKTLEHCIENISDGGNTSGKGFKRKNIEDIKERPLDEDILGGNTSKRKLTTFIEESFMRDKRFKDTEKTLVHSVENICDIGNTSEKGFKRKIIEDIEETWLDEDILEEEIVFSSEELEEDCEESPSTRVTRSATKSKQLSDENAPDT